MYYILYRSFVILYILQLPFSWWLNIRKTSKLNGLNLTIAVCKTSIRWQLIWFLEIIFISVYLSAGNFTCLAVVFNLRRRLGYHLFHTYVPSAITVVMSWISFWIKPEAIPARVTLGVTSLLTLGNIHYINFICDNSSKNIWNCQFLASNEIYLLSDIF